MSLTPLGAHDFATTGFPKPFGSCLMRFQFILLVLLPPLLSWAHFLLPLTANLTITTNQLRSIRTDYIQKRSV